MFVHILLMIFISLFSSGASADQVFEDDIQIMDQSEQDLSALASTDGTQDIAVSETGIALTLSTIAAISILRRKKNQ